MDFRKKNVLITGASQGLGEALAYQFARSGAYVILTARNIEKLQKVADKIQAEGGNCEFHPLDVMDDTSVEKLFHDLHQKLDYLDVLVNNAGILKDWGFATGTMEQFHQILNTNVMGYMRMILTFRPILGRPLPPKKGKPPTNQKEGMVIIISSVAGMVMAPNLQFYGITKSATAMMARALRTQYALDKQPQMKVLNINPPQFDTEIYRGTELEAWVERLRSQGSIPTAEDFARSIFKAAKKEKKSLTLTASGKIGGAGGWMFPNFFDAMARKFYYRSQQPVKKEQN
jgi:short-subunit dehydrogenase